MDFLIIDWTGMSGAVSVTLSGLALVIAAIGKVKSDKNTIEVNTLKSSNDILDKTNIDLTELNESLKQMLELHKKNYEDVAKLNEELRNEVISVTALNKKLREEIKTLGLENERKESVIVGLQKRVSDLESKFK